MERLIKDASELKDIQQELGITVDASSMSFDNIVNAISVMQSKLDIAGTSTEEATTTIQGSWTMTAAAWQNLITGFADGEADLETLTQNFVDSLIGYTDESGNQVKGLIDNIVPATSTAIKSIGTVLGKLIERLAIELPSIIEQTLPDILTAAVNALMGIVKAVPKIIRPLLTALKSAINEICKQLPDLLDTIIEFIENDFPMVIDAVIDLVLTLIERITEPDILGKLIESGIKGIIALNEGLMQGLPKIIESLPKIVNNIVNSLAQNTPLMIQAGIELFVSLVKNLPAIIAGIIKSIPDIIQAILTSFFPLGGQLGNIFSGAWESIKSIFNPEMVGRFFGQVWSGIQNAFSHVTDFFKNAFSAAWDAVKNVFAPVGEMFSNIGRSIVNALSSVINNIIKGINEVVAIPFRGINYVLSSLRDVKIFDWYPFDWISEIPIPQLPTIPKLAQGGVLKRGQMALLEGEGDEAVIPLSQNTEWIEKVANSLKEKEEPQQVNYYFSFNIDHMAANSRDDVEKLAYTIMDIISQNTVRRGAARA